MNDLNKKIIEALVNDEFTDDISEEQANALQLITKSFKGTFRLTFAVIVFLQIIFAGLAIFCGYQLINEFDLGLKINWLAGTLLSGVVFAIARLCFFMELNRLSVLREIKRVELQVSLLGNK
ncbi:MAG: DUF6768 family protein [Paraglaciecola sp.]|uniref:DUF6768 family protein n=1 Tax=Paraglaciecola sp. TaxID=1920173 RepID=UPI00326678DB